MSGAGARNNPHQKLVKKNKPGEKKLNVSAPSLASTRWGLPTATILIPLSRRHYFSRYVNDARDIEQVCGHCGAWKFPTETPGCCCLTGLVTVPSPQRPPEQFLRLFDNASFMNSIRVYNNVFAFTSIGASETTVLNVDDSVTRDGVYDFRVQ
ncbi:LOW QUALITY PROTEIN: Helitron helicase, partial [Phytophthora megakarya]